jgi:hypothetical protein
MNKLTLLEHLEQIGADPRELLYNVIDIMSNKEAISTLEQAATVMGVDIESENRYKDPLDEDDWVRYEHDDDYYD